MLALIKCIGSNDASLVRLAREKIHASSRADNIIEHRRLPAEKRAHDKAATLNAGERLESPSSTNANWRLRGIEIGKRTLNGECVGRRAGRRQDCPASQHVERTRATMGCRAKPAADSGEAPRPHDRRQWKQHRDRAAQRGNVRGALTARGQVASEALGYRCPCSPRTPRSTHTYHPSPPTAIGSAA